MTLSTARELLVDHIGLDSLKIFSYWGIYNYIWCHLLHMLQAKDKYFSSQSLENSSFLAIQFVYTVLLAVLTSLRICTAFLFFINVAFHVLFRSILLDRLISRELEHSHFMRGIAYTLCSAFGTGLPWMIILTMNVMILKLFVPLMGRSGSLVPPDLAIGVLTAILVVMSTPYMVRKLCCRLRSTYYHSHNLFMYHYPLCNTFTHYN